jgi:CBS-domain-containing membrane protein
MTEPLTVSPSEPAVRLTGPLTDGHRHAAMVVDPEGGVLRGLVTQADLLAALAASRSGVSG